MADNASIAGGVPDASSTGEAGSDQGASPVALDTMIKQLQKLKQQLLTGSEFLGVDILGRYLEHVFRFQRIEKHSISTYDRLINLHLQPVIDHLAKDTETADYLRGIEGDVLEKVFRTTVRSKIHCDELCAKTDEVLAGLRMLRDLSDLSNGKPARLQAALSRSVKVVEERRQLIHTLNGYLFNPNDLSIFDQDIVDKMTFTFKQEKPFWNAWCEYWNNEHGGEFGIGVQGKVAEIERSLKSCMRILE
ncbi:hypothetical protein GGR57DRAFT_509527 [Xylariaceae sp. FL1272]|nr:hypothetical protein GGR57DRAFT_509527 [Xylariaceae sp. FL1272]